MKRRFVFAMLCLLLGWRTVQALEPPTRDERERYRADGSLARRVAAARLLGNHRASPLLVEKLQRKLARIAAGEEAVLPNAPRRTPPSGWSFRALPSRGTVRVLALLIAFADTPPVSSAGLIHGKLFGAGSESEAPYESLRNFYRRSSLGQLEIQGETLGWYTTPYPRGAVQKTDAGREKLIMEALHHYQAKGHDFRPYDNDGDGYVDYLVVIWSGWREGWADFWWGYQTSFSDNPAAVYDGKRLHTYSWQWESRNPRQKLPFTADTVIHETGHAMGLPDYYDYDGDVGPDGGVGGLDMMDSSGDHNCFSKFMLDWIQPTIVAAGGQELRLRPAAASPDAVLLMAGAKNSPFGEFFMAQNRDRSGNDGGMPGSGLLIWHVDSRLYQIPWHGELWDDFLFDNSYTEHKLLRLMEADGQENIETGNGRGDGGDYYNAGEFFNAVSAPSSDSYDFQPAANSRATTVSVDSISASGPDIICRAGAQGLMSVNLGVSRGTERSWLSTKDYARLALSVTANDPAYPLAATTIAVYRHDPGNLSWTKVGQHPGSALQNGALTLFDRNLDLQKTYDYQILILDSAGYIAGVSPRRTL